MAVSGDVLGIESVDSTLVLEASDPRKIASRIINIFLGLLSIIAVSLIIYAGFVWMTSEGNEEKISKAKGILKSAIIGLVIVLSSWGIVTFIFNQLAEKSSPSQDISKSTSAYFQSGIGAIGACSVESVYPEPGQKNISRNSMILVTFKEEIDPSSIIPLGNSFICLEENFIFESRTCSNPINFSFETNDNKIIVIFPDSLLGNDVSNSSYVVYFSNNVLKNDQSDSIFNTCSPQYLLWNFDVSNKLDLTPPQVISIFPQADNNKDAISLVSSLSFAQAEIRVLDIPNYFQAAEIVSITKGSNTYSDASAIINSNYNASFSNFSVVIVANNKAQLMAGTESLGVFDIIDKKVNFTNYFSFDIKDDFDNGNYWDIVIKKSIPADKIKLGSYEYTFVNGETNVYSISVEGNVINQAEQIYVALNDNPAVDVSISGSSIFLSSDIGGSSGNFIVLESNSNKISIIPFSGGADRVENYVVQDKKDKPMNSTIQINFNKAINPLTLSGTSEELKDYIRVINLSDENKMISGKFVISSNYKAVEFISDHKCGANSCGNDIFCLPANSNIKVEIMAADLFNCENNNNNCITKNPFSNCLDNICQDDSQNRYPLSQFPFTGITDTSGNSLDGNRDGYSYGPVSYFNQNNPNNLLVGDNFSWSFWVNDKIDSDPPKILEFSPISPASLFSPIEIIFNKLLSSASIRTGSSVLEKEDGAKIFHNRINLLGGQLVGYWLSFENEDVNPIDGDPDRTRVYINHAQFFEGADYKAQAGSGIMDIYQNCFKPSASINCNATPTEPSCCDLNPVAGSSCN